MTSLAWWWSPWCNNSSPLVLGTCGWRGISSEGHAWLYANADNGDTIWACTSLEASLCNPPSNSVLWLKNLMLASSSNIVPSLEALQRSCTLCLFFAAVAESAVVRWLATIGFVSVVVIVVVVIGGYPQGSVTAWHEAVHVDRHGGKLGNYSCMPLTSSASAEIARWRLVLAVFVVVAQQPNNGSTRFFIGVVMCFEVSN